MTSFNRFILKKEYARLEELGDSLADIEPLIDWEFFRPIIAGMFDNKTKKGGRPNNDEIVMMKTMILQQWYGLSDPETERQIIDRISFRKFLGFPEEIPDRCTIWTFRERLAETGKDKEIWDEFQRQLDAKGLKVENGVIQDATFITSDPGHKKADEPRGPEAKTRRSKDGTWAKKGNKSFFGYKLHTKMDIEHQLIRDYNTTTASVHDSQIDLTQKGEVNYRDKGYFGAECAGFDAGMKRAVRNHPLTIQDKKRNQRISRKRSPGERPYAVFQTVFNVKHTLLTMIERVDVKNMFSCFNFDLFQLRTLKKQGRIA
jgi:IS5 family transposase